MRETETLQLHRERTALLVIDVQTRLSAAMPPERLAAVQRNTVVLVEAAKVLGLPLFVTEQYPKGLGPTVPEVAAALPEGQPIYDKVCFSCTGVRELMHELRSTDAEQILVAGQETHVCVYQTARDLRAAGFGVQVVEDAVISRTPENHALGLRLVERAGGYRTSTETAIFDLLQQSGTPEFKALAPLIK